MMRDRILSFAGKLPLKMAEALNRMRKAHAAGIKAKEAIA